ncbi:uncharacterized protein CDAR_545701 [Caerostris darwini]|uniref:Uncharacterized protein n=1 Tax=Caerostris darwini TaxID=1538125 RepID=A0AAV4WV55_9ARAC|nr:uncharacterized protein CDAR_545701 [Caerostris darwini]
MKFSGGRTQPEDQELTAESPESIHPRSRALTTHKDPDSQSTRGDYAAPATTAVDVESDNSRNQQFNRTSANIPETILLGFCRNHLWYNLQKQIGL